MPQRHAGLLHEFWQNHSVQALVQRRIQNVTLGAPPHRVPLPGFSLTRKVLPSEAAQVLNSNLDAAAGNQQLREEGRQDDASVPATLAPEARLVGRVAVVVEVWQCFAQQANISNTQLPAAYKRRDGLGVSAHVTTFLCWIVQVQHTKLCVDVQYILHALAVVRWAVFRGDCATEA